jgi:hypothetical protein
MIEDEAEPMEDFLKVLVSIPEGSGFEEELAREMFRQLGQIVHAHKLSVSFLTELNAAVIDDLRRKI